MFDGFSCTCKTGYHLIDGMCSTCPQNFTYNPALSICVPICKDNSELVEDKCVCVEGSH